MGSPPRSAIHALLSSLIIVSALLAPTPSHADDDDIVDVVGYRSVVLRPAYESELRIPCWWSRSIDEYDETVKRAVVVIHGTLRNADDYYNDIWQAAQIAGGAQDTTLIIAPQFLTEADVEHHNLSDDILYWQYRGWWQGDQSLDTINHPRPWDISSFAVVDSIIHRLAVNNPNLGQVVVVGHSAGGQFVNRYAAGNQIEQVVGNLNGVSVRYIVSNPSSYLYLNAERWEPGTGWEFSIPSADAIASCPEYNTYKWGLEDPNEYMSIGSEEIRQQYAQRAVIYLLGELDARPDDIELDTECMDMMQGVHRLQRGIVYTRHLTDLFGTGVLDLHSLVIVPGIDHDHSGMLTSNCGVRHLFDYGFCGSFPLSLTWVDVTDASSWVRGSGSAWGDYDRDGKVDLLSSIRDIYRSAKLIHNEGDGTFTDVTGTAIGTMTAVQNLAWGDYDSDGDLDFYALRNWYNSKLFRNEGDGTFSDVTPPSLAFEDYYAQSLSWIDYDVDGDLDLYVGWLSGAHRNVLFRNDGNDEFTDVTLPPLDAPGGCSSSNWGDYDNDGDQDLYLGMFSGSRLLRNDGVGVFTNVTAGDLVQSPWTQCGIWGDYDNDCDLDLYLANFEGPNRLLRNDGNDLFIDVTAGPLADAGECFNATWVDYDNDGDLDLNVINRDSSVKMIRNDGDGTFSSEAIGYPLQKSESWYCNSASWCDFDLDGDLDFFVADWYELFRCNQLILNTLDTANHWLHIDLVGTASNASGVGARIRIVAEGVAQIRDVGDGDSGATAQGSLTTEFGLGAATMVDTLQIRWPSGTFQEFLNLGADQRLAIGEDALPESVEDGNDSRAFSLGRTSPNPFGLKTSMTFELDVPGNVSFRIHDIQGRLVRTLVWNDHMVAGHHSVAWDGKDDAGSAVTPGVYIYSLEANGRTSAGRAVHLR